MSDQSKTCFDHICNSRTLQVFSTDTEAREGVVVLCYTWNGPENLALLGVEEAPVEEEQQQQPDEHGPSAPSAAELEQMPLPELRDLVLRLRLAQQQRLRSVLERSELVLCGFEGLADEELLGLWRG